MPEPSVLAYSRDSVVAEKLEAIIVLGDRNSRIMDFFDLKHLAENFAFDRPTLTETVRRTLERRKTDLTDEVPFGLTGPIGIPQAARSTFTPSRDGRGSTSIPKS